MSIGKWILSGLGWTFGGPIGLVLGYGLGKLLFDENNKDYSSDKSKGSKYFKHEPDADLTLALLVLKIGRAHV